MIHEISLYLSGALAVLAWIAGLFFLKYWRVSGDRFFLFFTAAFWSLSINWTALAAIAPAEETRHYLYLIRLLAFLLIIVAILDKNRKR